MHKEVTVEHAIGQHLMIGIQGTELDETFIDLVKKYKIGNVILKKRNIVKREQVQKLCASIRDLIKQETGSEPIIAISEEGGTFSNLPNDVAHIPGAMALAATGDVGNAYTAGRVLAHELSALGITSNLGPVLDIHSNKTNVATHVRSYSDKPETVAEFTSSMIQGLTDGNILSMCTTFPGSGDTEANSKTGLPLLGKSREEWAACEIVPFLAAITRKCPGIVVGHISFPAIDAQQSPASISHTIITKLLRGELHYDGLVCTQCLQQDEIAHHYGTVHAAVHALRAGSDIIQLSESYQIIPEVVQALTESYQTSYLHWEENVYSLNRIYSIKQKFSYNPSSTSSVDSDEHRGVARAIMDRALSTGNRPQAELPDLGENPLFIGFHPFLSNQEESTVSSCPPFPVWMSQHIGGKYVITPEDPDNSDIISLLEETKGASAIVIGTYNGYAKKGQLALANAMAGTGLPTLVVALGNPYDILYLAENIFSFAAFDYTSLSFESVRCVLVKERTATGILPIHW